MPVKRTVHTLTRVGMCAELLLPLLQLLLLKQQLFLKVSSETESNKSPWAKPQRPGRGLTLLACRLVVITYPYTAAVLTHSSSSSHPHEGEVVPCISTHPTCFSPEHSPLVKCPHPIQAVQIKPDCHQVPQELLLSASFISLGESLPKF